MDYLLQDFLLTDNQKKQLLLQYERGNNTTALFKTATQLYDVNKLKQRSKH